MAEKAVKEKKKHKGLKIALIIILALVVLAAILVFGVYRGMNIFLKAELGDGLPDASAFMKSDAKASCGQAGCEPDR